MKLKQEELIKACTELLLKLCDLVEARNSINFYDINISSEYFFIPLLNQVFDCDLKNLNTEEKNAAAIDLYDVNGEIAVQVTSDSSANKIHKTLKKYRENKHYEQYNRLIVVVIVPSHNYKADFTNDIDGKFSFSKSNDIYTINSLIKAISALNIEKIASIKEYLEYQLDTLLDETQVSTIEQSFNYISKNTGNILNEAFFEIDDERFIDDFKKKLDDSSIIHLSSLSIEEGRYCILNLLHKLKPDTPVYIIKLRVIWDKAEKHLSGCILIPDFQADEIPAIKNNTTIFIKRADYNGNAIKIPRRTINFLSEKLRNNGCDDSYKLLRKTQGLYYYLKTELFTGESSHPRWESDNNIAVIIAILLGKWTTCDGDKEIIEKLYGGKYEDFILYLNQYTGIDDAFIVNKRDRSYNSTCELADHFLSICSHKNIVNLQVTNDFFELVKDIISDVDPLFNESIDKHYLLSAIRKQKYSNSLKIGVIHSLILLAVYVECQGKVNAIVRDILAKISSVNDWAYISQFIELLGEASPDAVIESFEKSLNDSTDFFDIFTAEKNNFLMGRHYYTHILWGLEQLLSCNKYAVRSVLILLAIGEKIEKCSTGNNPRDDLSKVFCTWYNVSALSIEQKIELAKTGVEKYPYFWDILYNQIGRNNPVLGKSEYIYRGTDELKQYTYGDIFQFYVSYTKILLDNVNGDVIRLIKLLELLPECTDELFDNIKTYLNTLLPELCDSNKEQIKTALRKVVYKHRHFANAEWAAPSERIEKIEEICLSISFNDPAFDFLYLTDTGETPIFNPVAFESEGDYYHKNKKAIADTVASEMRRFKESGVDLSHFLSLSKIETYSKIGVYLAKYYSNSKYEERILTAIIASAHSPRIAVDYVCNCSDSSLSEVYMAIEYLRKEHYADEFFVAFIAVLPFDEKSQPYIRELPGESAKKYWSYSKRYQLNNKDLLNEAIMNLLKYSNWEILYLVMREHETMLSVDEILTIVSDSTKKMIIENHTISNNEAYDIEEMLSIVYKRIDNEYENYPALFELEIRLFNVLGWEKMKCCQFLFANNANYYADILILLHNKESSEDKIPHDKYMTFYSLEHDIKFCPGATNNTINTDTLNSWINAFRIRLTEGGQELLFYRKLGKLFACSPIGNDGLFPHEAIREKIEEIGNDELIHEFAFAIIYRRGMYTVTAGKDEYALAQKYDELRKKHEIRYPKTSKIFDIISNSYMNEAIQERYDAENEIF